MARIQLGKKEKIEVKEITSTIKSIIELTVQEILKSGFNGTAVLPDIWVIEKEVAQHIISTQPNLSDDITEQDIKEVTTSIVSSLQNKTRKADERIESRETLEKNIDVPVELPKQRMGNISVTKFPEGMESKQNVPKGYSKEGKFFKRDETKRVKRKSQKQMDDLKKERKKSLERIRTRRGLALNTKRNPKGIPSPISSFGNEKGLPFQINPEERKERLKDRVSRGAREGRQTIENLQDRASDAIPNRIDERKDRKEDRKKARAEKAIDSGKVDRRMERREKRRNKRNRD
tara:strand:- start:423 stop:1292 length:870 start_codon:yes stop_codon:yes gene_type:complete